MNRQRSKRKFILKKAGFRLYYLMPYELHTQMSLPLAQEAVFAFFADALNLEKITPPELSFQILSPLPIVMRQGTLIDYRLKLHGLPFRWRTLISAWEPPYHFVDEQIKGPYAFWHHTHTFTSTGGQTLITDNVRYALPGEPFSRFLHPLIRRQLDTIFRFRQMTIEKILLPHRGQVEQAPRS